MKLRFLNVAKNKTQISAGMGEFMVTDAEYDDLQTRYLSKQQDLAVILWESLPADHHSSILPHLYLQLLRLGMRSSPTQTPRHFPRRHTTFNLNLNLPPISHTPPYAP
jgi:hypothetical protein